MVEGPSHKRRSNASQDRATPRGDPRDNRKADGSASGYSASFEAHVKADRMTPASPSKEGCVDPQCPIRRLSGSSKWSFAYSGASSCSGEALPSAKKEPLL